MIAADRAAGLLPFFVCSTHGTTSSMAFDPTTEIGESAAARRVAARRCGDEWHRRASPEHRWVNDGLEHADSYCTNPHKWMGVELRLRPVLDRRPRGAARRAEHPARVSPFGGRRVRSAIDYRDWQIPLGRRFRALKLWFVIRLDGVAAIQAMIRRHVELTQRLAALVQADERFEVVAPHPLNLLCIGWPATTRPTS